MEHSSPQLEHELRIEALPLLQLLDVNVVLISVFSGTKRMLRIQLARSPGIKSELSL